jgi:magnesium transporter
MSDADEIARRFAASHPADAAAALESLDPEAAAAFMAGLEPAIAAALLAELPARMAAAVLSAVTVEQAAAAAGAMRPRAAAAVLRLLPKRRYEAVAGKLDGTAAAHFHRHLSYPDDTVGAWMEPGVPTFRDRMTAAEALAGLRASDDTGAWPLFMVGDGQRYAGTVALPALVRAAPDRPEWHSFEALPVIDGERRLVGALARAAMLAGIAGLPPPSRHRIPSATLLELSSSYYAGMTQLLQAVMEPPEAELPRRKKETAHERKR